MSLDEIQIETIPGLPEDLPAGERVLWQGRPQWTSLARQTFKVRWLVAYFAVFGGLRLAAGLQEHQGMAGFLKLLAVMGAAAGCLGVVSLMAYLYARMTVYTITTERIVFRIGVALPMTWNLPFKRLAAADLKVRKEGDGDIPLQLVAPNKIAWLHLWPHVQPGHYVNARPTLKSVPAAAKVAAILADAVQAWASAKAAAVMVSETSSFATKAVPSRLTAAGPKLAEAGQ